MPHNYQNLQIAVEDLQKIADSHKKFYGDDWHKITDANGEYLIAPVLDSLVYGYSKLAELELEVDDNVKYIDEHIPFSKATKLVYDTESGHALNCPAHLSDQAHCFCK